MKKHKKKRKKIPKENIDNVGAGERMYSRKTEQS